MVCRQLHISTDQSAPDGLAGLDALTGLLAQRLSPAPSVETQVREIIAQVQNRGDVALVDYTRRFDCPDFQPGMLRVPPEAIAAATDQADPEDLAAIRRAAERIRDFHQRQRRESWMVTKEDGSVLGQLVRPVDRAGLYVPGGLGGETPLISSLLMNAIPAQVAGVPGIAVVSPPRADGTIHPLILAAAAHLGIAEVYAAGSAWAVAALAFGTETIAPVDVIAGPGNIYVTTAKRLVQGHVGIDMLAGPSEVLVLADESAEPGWIAADMLSQAEHDPLAACILVTASAALAEQVCAELERQLAALPRAETARRALADWGAAVVVPDLDTGLTVVNRIAPEHLEILLAEPWNVLGRIRHAGAIFLGPHSPEPLGDYYAGPNHVLPTNGTARFAQALSVDTFCKHTSLIAASRSFLESAAGDVTRLARGEGLEAHARSVESRLSGKGR